MAYQGLVENPAPEMSQVSLKAVLNSFLYLQLLKKCCRDWENGLTVICQSTNV